MYKNENYKICFSQLSQSKIKGLFERQFFFERQIFSQMHAGDSTLLKGAEMYKMYERAHFTYATQFSVESNRCIVAHDRSVVVTENGPPLSSGIYSLSTTEYDLKHVFEDVVKRHDTKKGRIPCILMITDATIPLSGEIQRAISNIRLPGYKIRYEECPPIESRLVIMSLDMKSFSEVKRKEDPSPDSTNTNLKNPDILISHLTTQSPHSDILGYSRVSGIPEASLKYALLKGLRDLSDSSEPIGTIQRICIKVPTDKLNTEVTSPHPSDKLIATGACLTLKSNPQIGFLFEIAVLPEFQKYGFGTHVLNFLLQTCKYTKITQIILLTPLPNLIFFKKFGFVCCNRVEVVHVTPKW